MFLKREDVTFSNKKWHSDKIRNRDNLKLSALLRFQSKQKVVIVCHGFTGSKEGGGRAVEMADNLADIGFSTLLFDFAGCGESEGYWCDLTLTGQVNDLKSVIEWCKLKGFEDIFLTGRSFGGSTALSCASGENNNIKAVCTWAAVAKPAELFNSLLSDKLDGPGEDKIEIIDETGAAYQLKKNFFYDLENHDILDHASRIAPGKLLIIHGTDDQTVPVKQARDIYEAANEPRQLFIVEGADHRFSNHIKPVWDYFFQWLADI